MNKKNLFTNIAIFVTTLLFISAIIFQIYENDLSTIITMKKQNSEKNHVVLLHGLLRSSSAMKKIEKALHKNGYNVINFSYDSRAESIKLITDELDKKIKTKISDDIESIDFVTHSLGSIIVRYFLSHYKIEKLNRFVMIAPPNKGSSWGRFLSKNVPFIKWFLGGAGNEITKSEFPTPSCEFGVIAGGLGNSFGINPFLPGDNDMTVTVDETKLEGMKDFILIRGQHSTLLIQNRVINNIIHFLNKGSFIHK